MSQDNEEGGEQTPQPEDSIKNLKSEFSRKLDNVQSTVNEQLQAVLQQNEVIARQLEQALTSRSQPTKKEEPAFDPYDPDSIRRTIDQVVDQKVNTRADQFVEQQKKQQVLAELFNEYPELRDNNSEMAKATLAAYNSLDPQVRVRSEGYRLAVREAAANTGTLPTSKRKSKDGSDSFTLGTGSSSGGSRSSSKGSEELSDSTKFWAEQLLGEKSKSKEVQDRLKKRAKREKWTKWSDG